MTEINNWGADLSSAKAGDLIICNGTQYIRFNPQKHDIYPIIYHELGTPSTSGTGASVSSIDSKNYYASSNLSTGTTSSGYAGKSIQRLNIPDAAKILVSYNVTVSSNLSDATNEYEFYAGVWVGVINTPTDGYYIKYVRTSSTNWLCSTISSSTETATDSGITVTASTNFNLKMLYDSTTPDVKFYIDDTLVATNTTNVPTSSALGAFLRSIIIKTAGTTPRSMIVNGAFISIIRD